MDHHWKMYSKERIKDGIQNSVVDNNSTNTFWVTALWIDFVRYFQAEKGEYKGVPTLMEITTPMGNGVRQIFFS